MEDMNYQPPTPDDVRALRERHKLTQVQLAELAGVSARAVQKWEAPTKTLAHTYPSMQVWAIVLHKVGEQPISKMRRRRR